MVTHHRKKKSWHIFFDIVLETLWLNMHYVHIKPSTDIIFPHLHISFYSHEEREKKYLSFSHLFTGSWNFFSAFIFLIIWKTRNLCRKFFFLSFSFSCRVFMQNHSFSLNTRRSNMNERNGQRTNFWLKF